jgi:ssDNA-binding replication factor A large subunit
MPDDRLDKILNEMIRQRSDLTKDQLLGLIAEKKKKVGSGFLTDTGAGYLVASELNIDLNNVGLNDYPLKDLGPGMAAVNVKSYLLAASAARNFNRKDGTEGTYRSVFLFDDNITLRLMLWDAQAKDDKFATISVGEPIRISNVTTRMGRDNILEIHSSAQTKIELLDSHVHGSKMLDSITLKTSDVSFTRRGLVVKGFVTNDPKPISFQRQDGSAGKALQFTLSSQNSAESGLRLVLWSFRPEYETEVRRGMEIRLINVESKLQPAGSYELHGNEDTMIELLAAPDANPQSTNEDEPFIVISVGPIADISGRQRRSALLGRNKHTFLLAASDASARLFDSIDSGDQVRLKNYSVKADEIFVSNLSEDDLQLMGSSQEKLNEFKFRIQDLPDMRTAGLIELVVLAKPVSKDITLRDGKTVPMGEVLVGDETGESRLVAWRSLSDVLNGLLPGARLLIYGAVPRTDSRGNHSIELRDYSSVQHIRS